MMRSNDVWPWQGIVGNKRRDLFTGIGQALLSPVKLIHFFRFKLWKKIGRKLCWTCTSTHTHTNTLYTHIHRDILTHTRNQCCSCREIVNVKRQKWIMLMAWLTVVFNIMISNPWKIDYITCSLFTRWKKMYCPAVFWKNTEFREKSTFQVFMPGVRKRHSFWNIFLTNKRVASSSPLQ